MNSNTPTLYDRLGGVYAIATVVDDFIDRIPVRRRTGRVIPLEIWSRKPDEEVKIGQAINVSSVSDSSCPC
jgi:hypothetical protein